MGIIGDGPVCARRALCHNRTILMALRMGDDPATRLRRYHLTKDPALREQLVREHGGLARSLAHRFVSRGEPLDELTQVAMIGLAHALEGFDPDHGSSFEAYAQATIAGELKRHFRGTWRLRVPRSLQERYLQVRAAIEVLDQDLGRSPTIPEIADYAGVEEDAVVEAIEVGRNYRLTSIDAGSQGPETPEPIDLGREDHDFQRLEDRDAVASLVERLPERERTIIRLRFWDEMSQSEIAAHLGMSQMHVSRLLARSLSRLRTVVEHAQSTPEYIA
jgi:RNA polymerase sigma-B factor